MRSLLAFCSGALGVLLFCTIAEAQNPTLSVDLGKGVQMEFVLIRAGRFTQGSPAAEAGHQPDETQREVTLTQDFYMAKTPVTRGQFARFVEATRYRTEAEKGPSGGFGVVDGKLEQRPGFSWRQPGFQQTDDHPVVMVTFADAQSFGRWFTTSTHRAGALPTEAQWEYAVRAGSTGPRYAEPLNEVAWHRGNSGGMTHPTGQVKANAWGLSDAYGPVWQWCRDWYAPYGPGPATDPEQTNSVLSDKPRRVLRGGSFLSDASHARSAGRYRNDAASRNADNGFRLVCAVEEMRVAPVVESPLPPVSHERPASSMTPMHTLPENLSSSPFGFLPKVVIAIFVFAGGSILYKLVQAVRGGLRGMSSSMPVGRGTSFPGARFSTRVGPDGFWITGPSTLSGQPLYYTCMVNGERHEERVLFTPGPEGHFIFTGSRPTTVAVRSDAGAGSGRYSNSVCDSESLGQGMMMGQMDRDRSSFDSSSSSSTFPPAY